MDLRAAIQAVNDFLHDEMRPTGKSGFEGLVAILLQQATGQEFRLSSSGRQAGRDAGSESGLANSIKLEAKHYLATTPLNERELLAEISQAATSDPLLDIWVLAASRHVSEQIEHSLEGHAAAYGVEILVVDIGINGLPRLGVLMASFADIVVDFARRNGLSFGPDLQSALSTIASSPDFSSAQQRFFAKLRATSGYGAARLRNHRLLLDTLSDDLIARSTFRQTLGIRVSGTHVVRRASVSRELDEWWDDPSRPPAVAVLGEEGTGKTWAVFEWLLTRIKLGSMPLVLPFAVVAQNLAGSNPAEGLLPSLLERWTGRLDEQRWKRRLARWLAADPASTPLLLLVADGLNERPNIEWRSLLLTLLTPPFRGKVRIITSDRPHHWRSKCSLAGVTDFREVVVGTYTIAELDDALSSQGLSHREIPNELLPLISTPRYCRIAANHYREIVDASDFTRERLIYLEIRDRRRSKENYPLTDDQFFAVIRQLAESARGNPNLRPKDLRSLITVTGGDEGTVYEELASGGILLPVSVNGLTSSFRVDPLRLVFGLGMLLADELRERSSASEIEIGEFITAWFEPQPDMDRKVDICGSAMFHALFQDGFPDAPLRELIRYWLGLRNWADTAQQSFVDYVPRRPEIFIEVAEGFWSSDHDSGAAQEFLGAAFRKHRDHERVRPLLMRAIEGWMGFVHPLGRSFWRYDPRRNEQIRKSFEARGQNVILPPDEDGTEFTRMAEARAGCALNPGEIEVAGIPLTVVLDGPLLRLARLGLLIISDGPRLPFIRSLTHWAMASAVMDESGFYESVSWVVRLSDEELGPVLLTEAGLLLARKEPIARAAARFLLLSIGNAESERLIQQHELVPEWQIEQRDEHANDPCKSLYTWLDHECRLCLERNDVPLHLILDRAKSLILDPAETIPWSLVERAKEALAQIQPCLVRSGSLTSESHTLERVMGILCAHAPQDLAIFMRAVVRTLPDRDLTGKYFLAVNLAEISLVLKRREVATVGRAITGLLSNSKEWPQNDGDSPTENRRIAEARAFAAIMPHLSPEKAFGHLINRPARCRDLTSYELWFAPLQAAEAGRAIDLLHSSTDDETLIRVLWVFPYLKIPLSEKDRTRMVHLAKSENAHVRAGVLRAAVQMEDDSLGQRIADLGQTMDKEMNLWEAEWLTRLIARFATHVPFEDLAARLRPSYIGFVLGERGFCASEVTLYAECLDREWRNIVGAVQPDIHLLPKVAVTGVDTETVFPELYEPSEARNIRLDRANSWTSGKPTSGAEAFQMTFGGDGEERVRQINHDRRQKVDAILAAWKTDAYQWYGRTFSLNVIDKVYDVTDQMVEHWAEPALRDTLTGKAVRVRLGSLLEPICRVLLDRNPHMGLTLWNVLRSDEDNPLVFDTVSIAFAAKDSPQSELARKVVLDECWNDAALARLAFVATRASQQQWLNNAIEDLLVAPQLWRRMKGLTLACFSDITPSSFEMLVAKGEVAGSWVDENLRPLRESIHRNSLARHWYAVFLSVEDADAAWGALEIVASVADERLLIWDKEIERQFSGNPRAHRRLQFFDLRWSKRDLGQELSHERNRKERLFGIKFEREEIAPFL